MKRIEKIIGEHLEYRDEFSGSRLPTFSALMVGGKSERKQTRRKKESTRSLYIWNKITCVCGCVAASLLMIAVRLGIYIHNDGKAGWNSSQFIRFCFSTKLNVNDLGDQLSDSYI